MTAGRQRIQAYVLEAPVGAPIDRAWHHVPDPAFHVFWVGTRGGTGQLFARGAMHRRTPLGAIPAEEILGCRVPLCHPDLTRERLARLRGVIRLSDLWGRQGEKLERDLGSTATLEERFGLLLDAVERRFSPDRGDGGVLARAFEWLERTEGTLRIDDLAGHVGASPRTLQRSFRGTIGLTAKLLSRMFRVRASLRLLAQRGSGADLAAELGYADQSHFIADFRDLMGGPPSRFVRAPAGLRYARWGWLPPCVLSDKLPTEVDTR